MNSGSGTVRSTEALRRARRDLFESFPHRTAPASVLRYQEVLADEILRTESEKRLQPSPVMKMHLHRLRLYGDALAHTLLSRYAIRQLARSPGKPPALTGQGQAFSIVMDTARTIAEEGVCPLVADLTHSIRNGDVIACEHDDLPRIIECKTSPPKRERFEHQGRRGRQLAKRTSIHRFLHTGHGVIFGDTFARSTFQLARAPQYSWSMLDELTTLALNGKSAGMTPQVGELICVASLAEVVDTTASLAGMEVAIGDHVIVGSTMEALSWGPSDVPPPMCWDIALDGRWALMEGDVSVTHALRLEALVGFGRDNVRVTGLVQTNDQIPWRYYLTVGDEVVSMSATMARDVVYCHMTLTSAGEAALEIARSIVGAPGRYA